MSVLPYAVHVTTDALSEQRHGSRRSPLDVGQRP
jgi:hypothetical protein